jgi:hypothetical protein
MTLRWLARELGKHDKRLVGFWPLQGNMLDYSGKCNHGKGVGGSYSNDYSQMYPVDLLLYASRRLKGYSFFYNLNQWINLGTVPDGNFSGSDSQFTVSFWLSLTDRNPNGGVVISRITPPVDASTGNPLGVYGWEIKFDPTGTKLRFVWHTGYTGDNNCYIVELPVSGLLSSVDGTIGWQHCVLTFDGTQVDPLSTTPTGITWYINGKPVSTTVRLSTPYGLAPIIYNMPQLMLIGNGSTYSLRGVALSLMRLYKALLAPVEVQRLYVQEKDVFLPRPRVKRPPATNICTLFLKSTEICTNAIPLYISGPKSANSGCSLFVNGWASINKSCTLYIRGHRSIATSGNPCTLYVNGKFIEAKYLNLAINTPPASLYPTGVGQYPYSIFLPTHPVPTGFLPSPPPVGTPYNHSMNLVLIGDKVGRTTRSMNMSILGQTQAFAKGTTLYLSNTSSGTNNRIPLNITSTGTGPGVPGTPNTRTMNLFIRRWPSNVTNLYIAASTPISNNRPLFIMGTKSTALAASGGGGVVPDTVSMEYWMDGLPLVGVRGKGDRGTIKYWMDGIPGETIFKPLQILPPTTQPNSISLSIPSVRGIYDKIKPTLFTSGF